MNTMKQALLTTLISIASIWLSGSFVYAASDMLVEETSEVFVDEFNPTFTTLNGNVFMIAKIPEFNYRLQNGNKVVFIFKGGERRELYHIETTNASLLTEQDFDLLAFVPEEVTRDLINRNLKKVIIYKPEGKQVIKLKKGEVNFYTR